MVSSPRQRYRDQVRAEIKQAALAQIGEGGVGALSLNAVAKQFGMTGPALYKYFRSRDDLLTELIIEGFDDVARAVYAAVREGVPARERLHALAEAFHRWALAKPHLFQLLFGTPVAGYQAPQETSEQARGVMGPFLPIFAQGTAPASLRAEVVQWMEDMPLVATWVHVFAPDGDPASALAGGVMVWARLHGIISLEVEGQFAGMGHRAETLRVIEMDSLADLWGI
ncbi:TetR/AcrR family transcriptional regulator [Sinosporangium siamense]